MSLMINIDKIKGICLTDGHWHEVKWDKDDEGREVSTLTMDAYEFVDTDGNDYLLGGDQKGVPSLGATWVGVDGKSIYCPITSILAVSY